MTDMEPDLIEIFKEESQERLSRIATRIDQMRNNENMEAGLEDINRELHTIKGSVKMIGFGELGTFVHEVEGLTPLISKAGRADGEALDLMEEACDAIASHVDMIIEDGQDRSPSYLLQKIQKLTSGASKEPQSGSAVPSPAPQALPDSPQYQPITTTKSEQRSQSNSELVWSTVAQPEPPQPDGKPTDSEGEIRAANEAETDTRKLKRPDRTAKRRNQGGEELVRVRSSKLASLDTLVSDLIDSRLRFDHHERSLESLLKKVERVSPGEEVVKDLYQTFHEDRHHLNLIVKGLEQIAIDLRLRPLSKVFEQIARSGRELARKFGKKVRIQISGENTELDRVILDGIRDPLAHVIRNVIDHGIEMPQTRIANGKDEKGTVELSAFQDGVAVVVRVSDDGAGVNTDQLKIRVVEKGLLTEDDASKMTHKELLDLVFIPGISTRTTATETSGRGVGMDVVRRNVEALKGEAHIDSQLGRGTAIELRVPLTLLVSRVLLVSVDESIFAFPTESLDSTESMHVDNYTEYAGMRVFRVRNKYVPITPLKKLLNLPEPEEPNPQRRLIVVRHKEELLALEIDEFIGERSVVIKPLGWPLVNVPAISGAVLLGSGEMALTLHVPGLIERFYSNAPKGQTKRLMARERENRKIILVVDDSKIYRNMARNSLESLGYSVQIATDGEDGWEQLNQNIPDLILTDFEMPRLNGLELTRRIKSSDHYKHIPVIMISTHSDKEDKDLGFAAGVDDYLSKTEWNDKILNEAIRKQIF
jgi:two-component system, chemotaxis family, sensor kinase CheA